MKYCRLCGEELPEEARFCAACGKPQPEAEKSNSQAGIYGNCGETLEPRWKLCPFCGASLTGGSVHAEEPGTALVPVENRELAVPDAPEKAGLYAGGAYQGPLELLDALDWIVMNAEDGGNYRVVLGKDEAVPYVIFQFEGKRITVSLQGDEHERTVSWEAPIDKPMFAVPSGVTFTLEAGITLKGLAESGSSVVAVEKGGNFTMTGGSISGNSASNKGGGVYVSERGNFIMNGGSISRNSAAYYGGGVFVSNGGNFIMNGGSISRNSTLYSGGGVFVSNGGNFTMTDGSISGNSASNKGGGVFVNLYGIFFKIGKGGVIYGSIAPEGQANKAQTGAAVYYANGNKYRNTTARVGTVIDTGKDGVAGGWE
ncbi:MAG: zinc-ribbon domain-containing protein [Spirochaetaceae bacterium]|nr:zinc-ribbon domain-containing protein [Spirochaetaceae bacterium]